MVGQAEAKSSLVMTKNYLFKRQDRARMAFFGVQEELEFWQSAIAYACMRVR